MTNFTGMGIHIKAKDIQVSRRFYESLGFSPVFGYGDDDFRASLPDGCGSAPERYRGLSYKLCDGCELEIAEGHIAVKQEVFSETIPSPKVSGMIRVESLVPIIEAAKDEISFPVRKYYWGSIEVALKDPDGFVLVFITPYSEEEFTKIKALIDIEVVEP